MVPTVKKAVFTLLICLFIILPVQVGVYASENAEALTIPAELPAIKLKKRQAALAISVESVLQKLKQKQEIILVDIGKGDEFDNYRDLLHNSLIISNTLFQ